MLLKKIELRDFRNYESLELEFHDRVNLFLGENAQGKTNLLEAIYLSALGRSFRTAQDSEMIRFGAEFLRVKVHAEKDNEDLLIDFVITEKNKGIKIDGRKIRRMAELFDHVYAVIFSPEDLRIVKDDPEKRRRFINMEISLTAPAYYSALVDYRRSLKQRNAFLRDCKITGNRVDREILDVWDEQLASYGAAIMIRRQKFIEKIAEISGDIHKKITDGREALKIEYEPSIEAVSGEREQKKIFLEALDEAFYGDVRNGTTGKGPHRDDIRISVNGNDIRKYGSQGQQRTAALALKLAEIKLIEEEKGETAILLLDDVMSELDNTRQNFLINSLGNVQLFITTTDLTEEVKRALPEGYTFRVTNGKTERMKND